MDAAQTFDARDIRSVFPRFTEEARKANQPIVELVRDIARRKKVTPAKFALAWLLAQKLWIVPIPGTRRLDRLDENLAALEVQFTTDELLDIDRATSKIQVHGARGTGTEQYL
jgi:aryl-alcohol dehydrogenase-like predicted oxidoreductase